MRSVGLAWASPWATKAKALIDEMLERDLSALDILVEMLDGIYLCEGLCSVAAIGIDKSGAKHVLGFKVGSSENSEVYRDLAGDLYRRGLRPVQWKHFLAALEQRDLERFPEYSPTYWKSLSLENKYRPS